MTQAALDPRRRTETRAGTGRSSGDGRRRARARPRAPRPSFAGVMTLPFFCGFDRESRADNTSPQCRTRRHAPAPPIRARHVPDRHRAIPERRPAARRPATAPDRHRLRRRQRDGVVRLLRVRHRRGAGIRPRVLSARRIAARRQSRRVRGIRARLRRAPARRDRVRPRRRPLRAQGVARVDAADHGRIDLRDRPAADLCAGRPVGAGRARRAAPAAGHRVRRRMGRRRTDDQRERAARAARLLRGVEPARRGRRLRAVVGRVSRRAGAAGRHVPHVGLAAAVPRERRDLRDRHLYSSPSAGKPRLRAGRQARRAHAFADRRVHPPPSEGNPARDGAACGRERRRVHLPRVLARLRQIRRHPERHDADRRDDRDDRRDGRDAHGAACPTGSAASPCT